MHTPIEHGFPALGPRCPKALVLKPGPEDPCPAHFCVFPVPNTPDLTNQLIQTTS